MRILYYIINNPTDYRLPIGVIKNDKDILELLDLGNNKFIDLQKVLENLKIKYLTFLSDNDFRVKLYKKLDEIAVTDPEVYFLALKGKIPDYKLRRLEKLQRIEFSAIACVNRYIDINRRLVIASASIITSEFSVVSKIILDYNKGVDEMPLQLLKRMILKLEGFYKRFIFTNIIFGYDPSLINSKIDFGNPIKEIKTNIHYVSPLDNSKESIYIRNLSNYMLTNKGVYNYQMFIE